MILKAGPYEFTDTLFSRVGGGDPNPCPAPNNPVSVDSEIILIMVLSMIFTRVLCMISLVLRVIPFVLSEKLLLHLVVDGPISEVRAHLCRTINFCYTTEIVMTTLA